MMTFAAHSFREELIAMQFTFNGHFQKLGWIPLAVHGVVEFIPFVDWIKGDEIRAADYLAINALDGESAAEAAKANVVGAREIAKQYYNGLFRLYREYDKAVESAYRKQYRKNGAPQEELTLSGAVA